jgi:hypothetical protein
MAVGAKRVYERRSRSGGGAVAAGGVGESVAPHPSQKALSGGSGRPQAGHECSGRAPQKAEAARVSLFQVEQFIAIAAGPSAQGSFRPRFLLVPAILHGQGAGAIWALQKTGVPV